MNIDRSIFNLQNGAYIVTGGLGFLGSYHCKAIAAFGGIPIALDLNLDNASLLRKEIQKEYSVELICYEADITSKDNLKEIANDISKNLQIKGLVNNAARNPIVDNNGLKNNSRFENFPIETWQLDLDVGLTGAFLCTQVFGSIMNDNDGGSIVNISSDLGIIAPKQSLYFQEGKSREEQSVKPVSYSVIKSGLIGLTRYTSTYWPENIRCNCLCPGGILNNQSKDFLNKVNKEIPLGRLAKPEEYSGALIYLLSNSSSYLNGSIISIDGGRTTW